jgi:hypothetical protein
MADNYHYRRGFEGISGSEHTLDQRQFSRAVEHFGQRGLHARALSGGENHNVEVRHQCGDATPIVAR